MMKRTPRPDNVLIVEPPAPISANIKLMERLATGKKPEVDRKEMKRLTQKNF
jgi:hypothetical protein